MATQAGYLNKNSQILSISTISSQYITQVGDVVIGRVTEISHSGWVVDISSYALG